MKINYKYYGKGKETVLFLHGWGANLNSFNFFCENLKNEYKILQIDFVGHGDSEKLSYPFFVFDYAVEVFKILKKENVDRLNIVCHSFGFRVAIMLIKFFDITVEKLFVSGGAGVKPRFNIFTKLKIYSYKFKKFLNNKGLCCFDILNKGSSDYQKLNNIEKESFRNIVNYNQSKYLKFIKAKTILLWGNKDKETPLYMAKFIKKKIKNSKLVVLKNTGHFCFLENKFYSLKILEELLGN
ncbi:MAG: alpha/beta hydrolase [Clostridia bacterium]|nr:alpha/beta hydrolase [Clostridia bacterium]